MNPGEVIFKLNIPTRNGNVYSEECFSNLRNHYSLSSSFPPEKANIERKLTVLEEDTLGHVVNVRVEKNSIIGDIILFSDRLEKYPASISLVPFGRGKIVEEDGQTEDDKL